MRELFIYWRTASATAAEAERDAMLWQADLCRRFSGLSTALYRRAETPASEAPATTTVMETYAGTGLDEALAARIVDEGDARLGRWLQGTRKVEVFVRCSPEPSCD